MSSRRDLEWPFFDGTHASLGSALDGWCTSELGAHATVPPGQYVEPSRQEVDDHCRKLVTQLGAGGWLRYAVPRSHGGQFEALDSRSLCIIRETLAARDGLADFAFAMQGLGSGAISLAGSDALKEQYLPGVGSGAMIAAFALSEPNAGSDVGAIALTATRHGSDYVLNGKKTWISNGGIADFYTVFARASDASEERGTRAISAFVVPARSAGFSIANRIDVIAPHPLATIEFKDCKIPASCRLGEPGEGFKIAMRTLDIFRTSVAAAALGFARRALDETLRYCAERKMFGHALADFQLTQAALADMATGIDAAALLTYRAAWLRDVKGVSTTREAAMAKWNATETAQRIIDRAVQCFGGLGVTRGQIVESLYREIRALRIYEGASEVQQMIIGRDLLKHGA